MATWKSQILLYNLMYFSRIAVATEGAVGLGETQVGGGWVR